MGAVSRLGVVAMILMLASSACSGDDGERKRAEAAEWCEVTSKIDELFDDRDGMRALSGQIEWDRAAEWVDVAPAESRAATERAALILKEIPTDPRPAELADARTEIGVYAAEYCPAPVQCIADVEGNPRLPCI